MVENGINWGQCYGFAYKLAKDIWGTTEFNTRNVDQSYEPKIGDNVRLEFPVETSSGTKHSLNLGTTSNGSIFGANMTDSVTLDLNNRPSNITTYQKLNIRNQDKTYWENNNIYIYGKYFKLYNQNKHLGQVDRYVGYLRPEQ